ncbi:MAG TPA: hypothetical protein VNL71_11695 [Chloroflexota bacterium]|nr:hypothetical protein [Chloroflexota bacterium]
MSRRSPFWQPFTARTPLGYRLAGFFSQEPGPAYGTIRFTHVDGPLKRPYTSPPIPAPLPPGRLAEALRIAADETVVEVRVTPRPDGATIALYPLYDADGALVEVVPRTPDTVVVADTPWRPLATLVQTARHAGMEEAVRRLRAVLVFSLEGSLNPRIALHRDPLRLTLVTGLPGSGRSRAHHGQLRVWASQYGLDVAAAIAEYKHMPPPEDLLARLPTVADPLPSPGSWSATGVQLAISSRAGAELIDLPAGAPALGEDGYGAIGLWDAMARVADRGAVPTWESVAPTLGAGAPGDFGAELGQAWLAWEAAYPEAFQNLDQMAV